MKISRLNISLICFLVTSSFLFAMSANPIYYTDSNKYHIVKKGDNLTNISNQYNIPVDLLRLYNNLATDRIIVGQKLYLTPVKVEKQEYITIRKIPSNGYHVAKKGDSLSRLARMYDLTIIELIEYNSLSEFTITEGDKINLKDGMKKEEKPDPIVKDQQQPQASKTPKQKVVKKITKSDKKAESTSLFCPVEGKITSGFGNRNGKPHKGVDIAASKGTPIHSVQNGKVVFSGRQRGYGNVIIIEHDDYVMTVYAHNESNLVRLGDLVDKGQPIATVGSSGTSSGPHLHFEYRVQGKAINPVQVLTCLQ